MGSLLILIKHSDGGADGNLRLPPRHGEKGVWIRLGCRIQDQSSIGQKLRRVGTLLSLVRVPEKVFGAYGMEGTEL